MVLNDYGHNVFYLTLFIQTMAASYSGCYRASALFCNLDRLCKSQNPEMQHRPTASVSFSSKYPINVMQIAVPGSV